MIFSVHYIHECFEMFTGWPDVNKAQAHWDLKTYCRWATCASRENLLFADRPADYSGLPPRRSEYAPEK